MKKWLVIVTAILIVSGCSSTRLPEKQREQVVEEFIKAESLTSERSISAFDLYSWSIVTDQYIILQSTPSRHFLVRLFNRCSELDYASAIVVDRRMSGMLTAGSDSVYTTQTPNFKCFINDIYPLTKEQHKQLRESLKVDSAPKLFTDDGKEAMAK